MGFVYDSDLEIVVALALTAGLWLVAIFSLSIFMFVLAVCWSIVTAIVLLLRV